MNDILGGIHYLPNKGRHMTLMWGADLYPPLPTYMCYNIQSKATWHRQYLAFS